MAAPTPLIAEPREKLGTRTTRRLRAAGKLPGVIYGHNEKNLSVSVPAKPFNESLAKGAHVFELGLGSTKENVLVKDVQFDHLGMHIIHVDFARVDLNERVTVNVSIELKGQSKGEKAGGVLTQTLNEVEIECVVTEIPGEIVYDISGLELDKPLHVSELKLPAGVKMVTDGEFIVAVVRLITEDDSASAEEGANEPEVIKKERAADDAEEEKK
jgi:large subunit ribosomal protein L25